MSHSSSIPSPQDLKSAKEGSHHWLWQRISAIGILPTGLLLLLWILAHVHDSYGNIIQSLHNPWIPALIFLFISLTTYHAALGMQVIVEDYIHHKFWQYGLIIKIKLLTFLLPILTLFFLIKIMLIVS